MSFIPEILEGHFVAKLQENRDRQFKLAKRSDCEAQKDLIVTQIVDTECQLLETLDSFKVVHQAIMGMSLLATIVKLF